MKYLLALAFSLNAFATTVMIETNKGNIEVELDDVNAPVTVENFLGYVDAGFFTQTLFHRTIKNFVIQGGGLNLDMTEKPTGAPIRNEATNGLSNLRGTIAMARTNVIDSATSQFYINTVDNVRLNHQPGNPARYGYAVFGKVTRGLEVVDAIQNVPTHTLGEYADTPVEQVVIFSITRL
jgi:peptidyl-prolyl cis-trans isomerase A (cyclophilin A)